MLAKRSLKIYLLLPTTIKWLPLKYVPTNLDNGNLLPEIVLEYPLKVWTHCMLLIKIANDINCFLGIIGNMKQINIARGDCALSYHILSDPIQ